jgi:2-amino-4-hydroxy-6-hydroxymethyldihydropteridine diphosphokinase
MTTGSAQSATPSDKNGVQAFIGLGSNLGDRHSNLRAAVDALRETGGVSVIATSSIYETDPVGPPQPDFLNAVVEISTTLAPRELLGVLKDVEARIGRVPTERWGPREIDLDLLLYGEEALEEPGLVVPHPEMYARAFVLVPLTELHPELGGQTDGRGVRKTELLLD